MVEGVGVMKDEELKLEDIEEISRYERRRARGEALFLDV